MSTIRQIADIIREHQEVPTPLRRIEKCSCGESKVGEPGWYRKHLAESFAPLYWEALGHEAIDDGGLPVHLAMGVNKNGQGPEGDSVAHHYECWCGHPKCHWNVALERAAAVQRRRIAAALHAKADANVGYVDMEGWMEGYKNAAIDVEIEIDNLMERDD